MTTIYTNVPARRWWNGKGVCTTKAWRRIMGEIARCLKAGGAVELDQRRAIAPRNGETIEWIDVRLDWPEAPSCD